MKADPRFASSPPAPEDHIYLFSTQKNPFTVAPLPTATRGDSLPAEEALILPCCPYGDGAERKTQAGRGLRALQGQGGGLGRSGGDLGEDLGRDLGRTLGVNWGDSWEVLGRFG